MNDERKELIIDELYVPENISLSEQQKQEIEGFLKEHNISITD